MFNYVLIVCPFFKSLFKLFDFYIILKKIILSFFLQNIFWCKVFDQS